MSEETLAETRRRLLSEKEDLEQERSPPSVDPFLAEYYLDSLNETLEAVKRRLEAYRISTSGRCEQGGPVRDLSKRLVVLHMWPHDGSKVYFLGKVPLPVAGVYPRFLQTPKLKFPHICLILPEFHLVFLPLSHHHLQNGPPRRKLPPEPPFRKIRLTFHRTTLMMIMFPPTRCLGPKTRRKTFLLLLLQLFLTAATAPATGTSMTTRRKTDPLDLRRNPPFSLSLLHQFPPPIRRTLRS